MKKTFIRALWGIHDKEGRKSYQRRTKIDDDILLSKYNSFQQPFVNYVFGEDNYKYLCDEGFDCRLVDKRPIVWSMEEEQFRHKLEIFKVALEEYNKIVFLDWDVFFIKELPANFWEELNKKHPLQASLRIYARPKVYWRETDRRKIPCGSFIYIGDSKIPQDLISCWNGMRKKWSEELVIALYMDNLMGGFYIDKYWDMFEPMFFDLQRMCPKEIYKKKNISFLHVNKTRTNFYLNRISEGHAKSLPRWLKKSS